ncbi:hypothetical protein OSCT_1421 [Oscillochloris trichoides DG-6]|uniref:Uncharacterized protein n=1 Tax=Oscillochloris trichoides DG-6 TaxID=765420 RepID=E1IDM0_9CHLR|nr:hypothetical protein [Oscillochloris trichoides]EFO80728.1 hypothetical protein OSCT_1421 [Oscillochloris trichoides DG-6]
MKPIEFNFGPIARTSAGGNDDTINLASLPLHVLLNALTAATNAEEFIAWLWHDLYKPAFQWVKNKDNNFSWLHIPGVGAFQPAETIFAARTGVPKGLVSTHHPRVMDTHPELKSLPRFQILETDILSDQGDQVNLGSKVNYIQLSIAAEPALTTSLIRAVIADAFIEIVTRDVAISLQKKLQLKGTPIEQVRFEFKSISGLSSAVSFDDTEIWDKIGKFFDVRFDGTTFVMEHVTPLRHPTDAHLDAVFTADLTGNPLKPSEFINNTVSLSELLVLYQDSRTILIAVPQNKVYPIDQPKLDKIRRQTIVATRKRLDTFDVLTKVGDIDYLQVAFDAQVEIRSVPVIWDAIPNSKQKKRLLEKVILRPSELITIARNSTTGRICRITGTPFTSSLAPSSTNLSNLFSSSFVDTEFTGISGDISPLAYFYLLNSPNAGGAGIAGVSKRTSLRGSFMLLAPASHVALGEHKVQAIDQPLLDQGGRFVNTLSRVTITTQEFTLFQQMSRRIIADLWQSIAPSELLPLPYLGAVVLTHKQAQSIKLLLPKFKQLFVNVTLHAYPFKIMVRPAIEFVVEIALADQKHAGKHTLLKTTPRVVTIEPRSTVPLLIDDKVQINITARLFERTEMLYRLMQPLRRQKRQIKQSDLWLKLILDSNDPVTAVFESAQATLDSKKLPKSSSIEHEAFRDAEDFWLRHFDTGNPAQSWDAYEQQRDETSTTLEQFPAIMLLIRTLHDPDMKGLPS